MSNQPDAWLMFHDAAGRDYGGFFDVTAVDWSEHSSGLRVELVYSRHEQDNKKKMRKATISFRPAALQQILAAVLARATAAETIEDKLSEAEDALEEARRPTTESDD